MKKLLLSLTLLVGIAVHAAADPTAKAIYCAANTTLYFTFDEVTYNTSTAYDQLDGNKPTKVYNNISSTGYDVIPGIYYSNSSGSTNYAGDPSQNNNPWSYNYRKNITQVTILDNFYAWKPTSLKGFFFYLENLTTINGLGNINTSEVTSLDYTFTYCRNLSGIVGLSTWDVSKVTGLFYTFAWMTYLPSIEGVENWDTSNMTFLKNVFERCNTITDIDPVSGWDVSNVKSFVNTFAFCKNLSDIDALSQWDTSSMTDLYNTFGSCPITNVDALQDWDVSKAENIAYVFNGCRQLSNIDGLSKWDTSSATNMEYLFNMCSSITSDALMAIKDWDVSNVVLMYFTFGQMSVLTNVDALADWNTSSVQNMADTFVFNIKLKDVKGLSKWDTSNVITMAEMFSYCYELESLEGLEDWDLSSLVVLAGTFQSCRSLKNLDPISGWETPKLGSMSSTFNGCTALEGRINLLNWDLSNLNETEGGNCAAVNENASSAYLSWGSKNSLNQTFKGCSKVIGITLGKGNIGKEALTTTGYALQNTFLNCTSLRYIDISGCTDTYDNIVSASRNTNNTMFYTVPRTAVIYLPSGNTEAEESDHENVVYTASDGTLQCDKYYSEDKVDIELPHRFHADLATYERPFSKTYAGVILPYPVKINDSASDEFQPFILQEEYVEQMFFKGSDNVPANTPFVFKRKGSTDMKFAMEDVWVESTYDVNGETSDNIDPTFTAWKSQGFYVTHEIEPENGVFNIPTMDDYVGTETVAYDPNKVYYIASNKFYRTDPSTLYLDPHRILYYGQWEKFSGDISGARPAAFTIEELDENSPAITAIQEAELRLDESRAAAIYDASGNRLSETKRGVNILRMADGSVKKVLRK